jgi:hypothetical protein
MQAPVATLRPHEKVAAGQQASEDSALEFRPIA